MILLPGPGVPRFLLLRRRRAERSRRATASTSTSSGSSPRSAASIPANPVLPIPATPTGCRWRRSSRRRSSRSSGPTALASACRSVLIGSLAAPLTWSIARDVGALDGGRGSAPASSPRSRRPARCSWPSPRTSRSSSRSSPRRCGSRRAGCRASTALVRAGRAARRPGVARPERRRSSSALAVGLVVRLRPRPGLAVARPRSAPRLPWRAAVGCVALYLLVDGARGGSASWRSSARSRRRPRPATPSGSGHPGVEQHHRRSVPLEVPRPGPGPIIGSADRRARVGDRQLRGDHRARSSSSRSCRRRLAPAALDRLRAVVPLRGPRLPGATILYPLHVPGGAFIHSAVGLGPHAYILALEGVAALVMWIASAAPAWDPRTAIPLFVDGGRGVRRRCGPAVRVAPHGSWDESRAPRVALAASWTARRRAGRPADVDRRARASSTGRAGRAS